MSRHNAILSLRAIFLLALLSNVVLLAQDYQVYNLNDNSLLSSSCPYNIAEDGNIVGFGIDHDDHVKGVFWHEGGITLLTPLEGDHMSFTYDISEAGVPVGESIFTEDIGHMVKMTPHAVIWDAGQPVAISSLVTSGPEDFNLRHAFSINEKGQILGLGRYEKPEFARGYLFDDGIVTDLGALGGGNWPTQPNDMNEQGYVVGHSDTAMGERHAFIWKDGEMKDLHDDGVIDGYFSSANAINNFGVITGYANFQGPPGWYEAALWDHGKTLNLGTLGGNESYGNDINDHGTVVGVSFNSNHEPCAFIWRDNQMQDLNNFIPPNSGWVLCNAYAVNSSGVIVGEGLFGGGFTPFILYPDMKGNFKVYGAGCPGSSGFTPGLYGEIYPGSGGDISLVVVNGLGGAPGLLFFGAGQGAAPIAPGCELQILPLLPIAFWISLDGNYAGAGTWQLFSHISPSLDPGILYVQAAFMDAQGPGGYTVTNPLELTIK